MSEQIHVEQKNETMGENSFMKKLLKKRLNQKGLTLIELLAVIVILAIVAAIAVPAIGGIIATSRDKAVLADASAILAGARLAELGNECSSVTANNVVTVTCDDVDLQSYVDNITLGGNDQAVKIDNGEWTITHAPLARTWRISPAPTSNATITESALNTALEGNN